MTADGYIQDDGGADAIAEVVEPSTSFAAPIAAAEYLRQQMAE